MNKTLLLAMSMSCAFAFCGCDDEENSAPTVTDTPIVLSGKAYTFDPELEGEIWKRGKSVGVYMKKENSVETVSPYTNVKYNTTAEPLGYFSPETPATLINMPKEGNVDVVAYYPYSENLNSDSYPMTVANQKVSANFAFLYANAKGMNVQNNKMKLQFRPVLSQLIFNLIAGDGVTDEYLNESSIKVKGMPTVANFNILSGTFEQASDVKDIDMISFLPEEERGNGASGQVFPAVTTNGFSAEIKIARMNRTETWNFGDTEETRTLEQGIRYICNVTVSLDKIEVSVDKEAIDGWNKCERQEVTGEENLVLTDIEELPLNGITDCGADDPLKQRGDTWCYKTHSDMPFAVQVVSDDELNKNVIYGRFDSSSEIRWYKSYVLYRSGNAEAGVYSISFKAKGTADKSIRCYVATGDKKTFANGTSVFVANAKGTGTKPYNGYVNFTLTDKWTDYTLEFNFAKMVQDPYGFAETDLRNATAEALKDFYISFFNTANNTVVNFYLSDVVFKKID